MKRIFPTAFTVAFAVALLGAPGMQAFAQDKVVATIDGKPITEGDLAVAESEIGSDMGTMPYTVEAAQDKGPIDRGAFGTKKLPKPTGEFDIVLPAAAEGEDVLKVSTRYYYCPTDDDGKLCKFGAVTFTAPVTVKSSGAAEPVKLEHKIPAK